VTGLAGFAARRLGWAVLTVWIASLIAFAAFWAIPNVAPEFALGGGVKGTNESRAAAAAEYGLDRPLPEQYARLMSGIAGGDVECFSTCGDLRASFVAALPATVSVVAGAALLAVALATGLALVAVRHHGRRLDRAILTAGALLHSVPSLVLSTVLWAYLCQRAELFPYEGYVGLTDDPLRWAHGLVLPWLAAGLPLAGAYVQVVRAALLEARGAPWVRTARAKGLSERAVVRRHVLRTALTTPVHLFGLDVAHAFGGFVLYVEVVFRVPGVGALAEGALRTLDLPPLVALTMWLALVVVVVGAVVDLALAAVDPRVRA
jgi:peptide/nickel transport system permease protein